MGRVLMRLLVVGLCLILTGCGGSRSVAGTYVNENQRDTLELETDGDFYLVIVGIGIHGEYEVDGSTITLFFPDGSAWRGRIEGRKILLPPGMASFYGVEETWIKK